MLAQKSSHSDPEHLAFSFGREARRRGRREKERGRGRERERDGERESVSFRTTIKISQMLENMRIR
jgi:hypothetical protein